MKNKIEHIFHKYYSPLCNYASKYVSNNDDAEDIVQHLFVQLYQNNALAEVTNIENYLLRCVKFKCIDFIRTRRYTCPVEMIPEIGGDEYTEVNEEDIEPLFYYYASKLPPQTRKVFLMSRIGQLTYKQIAEELNLSPKTVENQISAALRKLRSIMQKDHYFLLSL